MKYDEIKKYVDKTERMDAGCKYGDKNEKFRLILSEFATFTDKAWWGVHDGTCENNWKAHISIHPDDLGIAWDLIFPLLSEQANMFKIVNRVAVESSIPGFEQKLMEAKLDHQQLIANYSNNIHTLESLHALAAKISGGSPQDKISSKQKVYEYIKSKYAEEEEKCIEQLADARRMSKGMQITLYMLPGEEKQKQALLQEIEVLLMKNDIRPGAIYETDRAIGEYSSIRHPGNKGHYNAAVTVSSYNPDNLPDDFKVLPTKHLAQLKNIIKKLNSFTVNENMSAIEELNVGVKLDLGKKLQEKLDSYNGKDKNTMIQNLTELKEECFKEYQAADKKLKHDSEWKPILKNLALFFSGIGTALAVVSLYYRATTGRYGLFDNREELLSNAPNPSNPSANSTQNYKNRFLNELNEETNPEKLEENANSFGA